MDMAVTTSLVGLLIYFFLVTWLGAQLQCGEKNHIATNEFKTFTFLQNTPGFFKDGNCTWHIEAEDEFKIVDTEVTNADVNVFSKSCTRTTNNLTAYDGPVASLEQVLLWCMSEKPTVTSSGRYLTFQLSVYAFLKIRAEFSFRYKQVVPPEICNGSLNSLTRFYVFTSPGYPRALQNNQHCSTIISTSNSYVLNLTVIDADMGSSCISIYDGATQTADLLTNICGRTSLSLTSSENFLLVVYSTGDNTTGSGFKMKYRSISNIYDCPSRTLTAYYERYELTSPFYPNHYPHNTDCIWTIKRAHAQDVIHIQILNFQLEDTVGCTADYLQIYDGGLFDSSIGKWCGDYLRLEWEGTGTHVSIKFHSNGRVSHSGFRLGYSSKYKSSSSSGDSTTFGLVTAAIILAIVCISFFVCCIVYQCRKKHQPRRGRNESLSQTVQSIRAHPHLQQQQSRPDRPGQEETVFTIGGDNTELNNTNFLPPPTYDEVISKDARNDPNPPPYNAIIAESKSEHTRADVDNGRTVDGSVEVRSQL